MTLRPRKSGRISAAVGGVLIMAGIAIVGAFALVLFNILDIETFSRGEYVVPFAAVLLIVGVLDLASSIILLRGGS